MKVIGTAGHIDHGKSTLVRRLTGIDPDRLAEEKLRGMTIDLGFAWLTLRTAGDVSVVDVPGHERFIKNMLAGAAGIDVVLLVVAADESVMPQTREHFEIISLLGVQSGVVALTKSDRVDAEWIDLVAADVEELLQGSDLEGSAIVPVSAVSGDGMDALVKALDVAVSRAAEPSDRGRPYMPVDRIFTIPGFGTVVTGTVHDGWFMTGEEITVMPSGFAARIRGIQTHNEQVERAGPGTRAALNLAGIGRDDVARGDVVSGPGAVQTVRRVDAHVRVLRSAPRPLRHGLELSVHIGAGEHRATLSILGTNEIEPGDDGWVQVRFAGPVPAARGQRFILRLPAPARTVAGGEVIDLAPRHRRLDLPALQRLRYLAGSAPRDVVLATLEDGRMRAVHQIAIESGLPLDRTAQILADLRADQQVVLVGELFTSTTALESVAAKASELLQEFHRRFPLKPGMPREELRSKLAIPSRRWTAILQYLVASGAVADAGSTVALAHFKGGSRLRMEQVERVIEVLRTGGMSPPSGKDLEQKANTTADLLAAMATEGHIVRLADGLFLERSVYTDMLRVTLDFLREHGTVSVAEVRDRFATSRKYALAFLEYLDGERITRRNGDTRTLGARASE